MRSLVAFGLLLIYLLVKPLSESGFRRLVSVPAGRLTNLTRYTPRLLDSGCSESYRIAGMNSTSELCKSYGGEMAHVRI
jgi:hypothetical protein